MLLGVVSRKCHSPTRRSPVGPVPIEGVGGPQIVQLLIDASVPPHPPPRHTRRGARGRAEEAEPGQGRAGQAGPTRRGTAHEERRTSEPMRQDRASRTPHQSRATTERRPVAAAEARQASSSGPARGQRQPITRELFPAIHPPAHHIEHDAEPPRSGARAGAQGSPIPSDSHRAQARQADKRRSPAARARTTPTAGPADDATRATPANHSTRGSSPPPIHTERPKANDSPRQDSTPDATPEATRGRRRRARQAGHQRQQRPTAERQEAAQEPEEQSQPA